MAGGITFIQAHNADIPTPASGKVTVFFSIEIGGPAYKDDTGTTYPLEGPAGIAGPIGPPGVTIEPDDPEMVFIPGPQGIQGPTGSSGPSGQAGQTVVLGMDALSEVDDNIPSNPVIFQYREIKTITCIIDGAGAVITTGVKGYFQTPVALTVLGWSVIGQDGATGSIVIDIWSKSTFPPTVTDTITAAAKPTVSGATNASSATLTAWITTIPANNYLGVKVDSVSTFTKVTLELFVGVNIR